MKIFLVKLVLAAKRILLLWLAAHIGCFVGGQVYFCAYNSPDSWLEHWTKDSPYILSRLLDLDAVRVLELAVPYSTVPWIFFVVFVGVKLFIACILGRKWLWLLVSVLLVSGILNFMIVLCWKVGDHTPFTWLFN